MDKKTNIYIINRGFFEDKWIIDSLLSEYNITEKVIISEKYDAETFCFKLFARDICSTDNRAVIIKCLPDKVNKFLLTNIKRIKKSKDLIIFNMKIPKAIDDIFKGNASYLTDNQKLKFNQINEFLNKSFQRYEKKIDEKVISILSNFFFFNKKEVDKDEVYLLLEKIIAYAGDNKKITLQDVQLVSYDYEDFVVWDLLNYIDKRDYISCSLLFSILVKNAKSIEHEIVQIIHTLIWKYRLSLFVSSAKNRGLSQDDTVIESQNLSKMINSGKGKRKIYEPEKDKSGNIKNIYSKNAIEREYKYGKVNIEFYGQVLSLLEFTLVQVRLGKHSEKAAIFYFDLFLLYLCGLSSSDEIKRRLFT